MRRPNAWVLRIAKNEVEKLTHGWFAVKSRSTQEIADGVTIDERHKREKAFFATQVPWAELKKDRVGIHALKTFLGGLLYNHIQSEFPEVVKDIEKLATSTQKELELLGPSRQTTADQRRFLTRLANAYQQKVSNALSGNYDAKLDGDSPIKLRMHKFNDSVFEQMISDEDLKQKLKGRLSAQEKNAYQDANEQLVKILIDERGGILQTVNHCFADNLSAIRQERVLARLEAAGFDDGDRFDVAGVMERVHLSNEDQAVNDIHDILKAYYKVAMKRFTDNVVLQVTERLLLSITTL
ncbi:dynamin family protein [Paraphaeosphaeria sporulosa]